MDNILKLLLGVLGVAGLITMVTSNLPFETESAAVALPPPLVTEGPPVNQNGEDIPIEEGEESSPEEDGEDIFAIGEPMIDGNPYGVNNQQPVQNEGQPPPDYSNFNYAQAGPQGYAAPPIYSPQPAPDNFAPIVNGQ